MLHHNVAFSGVSALVFETVIGSRHESRHVPFVSSASRQGEENPNGFAVLLGTTLLTRDRVPLLNFLQDALERPTRSRIGKFQLSTLCRAHWMKCCFTPKHMAGVKDQSLFLPVECRARQGGELTILSRTVRLRIVN